MSNKKYKEDKYSYKGWLNSDSFFKRSFAVLGYNWIAILMLYGIILGLIIILVIFFGVISIVF